MPRRVFLAAPELGDGALAAVDKLLATMEPLSAGALRAGDFFVPHLHVGDVGVETDAATYFERSLAALQEADVVVAVLDGAQVDENVAFWLGYAFAAGKPVVGYRSDRRATGPMPAGALAETVADPRTLAKALARRLG